MLVTDQPEDLPTTNALDGVVDPDAPSGERTEVYLSGAHVHTLDYSPRGLERMTFMVDVEVYEAGGVRFTGEDGETQVPICKVRRIGDMYLPGTQRPPSKDEIKAMQAKAKAEAEAKAAAEKEAEEAEAANNQPPLYPLPGEDQADEPEVDRPGFSDVE
ncbi:hypothetical protein [Mycolicibacterium fluoranthenivorans]|uniref:Uncharacterized protein n=1 Tax=Mycolicibacterium fluoranthenivorans TaxID=258505 RepID=A0A1G4X2M2_9MYCO|nr:hypothetical protein [Mycolicibacterium fluoranthenivorans]SCX34496.1 hypothetical protein SAMN02799620_06355 [Mycolicibacterium fluoranthenivorans]